MSVRSHKNFQYVFIGDTANKTTGRPSTLNTGEIGLFDKFGTRLTEASAAALTANDVFFIYLRPSNTNNTLVISPAIKVGSIKRGNRIVYTAEQEQIDTIGYNGTTGAVDNQNLTEYLVQLSLDQNVTSNHGGWYTIDAAYTSSASATQEEIVSEIVKVLVNNLSVEPDNIINVEMLLSDGGVAAGLIGDTVVGALGSKYVVITDGGGGAVTAMVAGGYIRLGTNLTDPVYKIASSTVGVTGGILTLEWPLQESVSLLGTTSEYISPALADAADAGITLTGIQKKFSVGKLHNGKVSWKTALGNWGSTDYEEVQKAHIGHGTERHIKELEWFTNGFDGEMYRKSEPYVFSQRALASGNYDTIHLYIEDSQSDVLGTNYSKYVMTICAPVNGNGAGTPPAYAAGGTANDITDVLEVLTFGAAGGELAL